MFNKGLNFYLKSSMHVAISAVTLTISNSLYLNKTVSVTYLVWLFSAALFYYNALKYLGPLRSSRIRSKIIERALVFVMAIAAGLSLYLFVSFTVDQYVFIGIASILGLSYALFPNAMFSRENGLFKTLMVALVWGILTVLAINQQWTSINTLVWSQFAATIFWILALMLPFELKDATSDQLRYKTVVQLLGQKKSAYLAQLFLMLWLGTMLTLPLSLGHHFALAVTYLIAALFIRHSMTRGHSFFVVFWVESLPIIGLIVQLVFYLLLK